MASYFTLTLDTLGPQTPSVVINAGASYAIDQVVTLGISTSDSDTTGYQIKVWGDVDPSYDGNVLTTEIASAWSTYVTSKQVKLSSGGGVKTVYLKIRDDVWNPSSQANDTITLDQTLPVVSMPIGPDNIKISKQAGKDVCSFSFQADTAFTDFVVKVVPTIDALHTAGTQIPTAGGSTNMSGSGSYSAATNIACQITGTDLEAVGSELNIIKVFIKETSGNWSAL
jgi:hypothetical protein